MSTRNPMHTNNYSNFIHNGSHSEATKRCPPIGEWINKMWNKRHRKTESHRKTQWNLRCINISL